MRQDKRRTRTGFTLIELLTVMAILAVMAGLLFPVIAKSREQARKTVCMSNLRQIGMALSMYASNHAGLIPPTGGSRRRATEHIWDGRRNPPRYVGLGYLHEKFGYGVAPQMYYCPAAQGMNSMDWPEHSWSCWEKVGPDWRHAVCGCSYVYRETAFGADKLLARNTDTPAMVMDFQVHVDQERYNHFLQGVNILFYDGSVKWVSDPTAQAAGFGNGSSASLEAAFRWADKQY